MAMLSRCDPARIQDEVGRFFEKRFFDDRQAMRSGESVGWTPACDIYQDEEGIALRFDLSGVEPKDVDIRFVNGVLTLRGERKLEGEKNRENYHRLEMSYGTFTRSFSLPDTIDADRIHAESKNGILAVFLPKKLEAKPKSIQVKVG